MKREAISGSLDTSLLATMFVILVLVPGAWAASESKVLHSFNGKDGGYSSSSLVLDASGNLYGTTFIGGAYEYGCVFELTHDDEGKWVEKVLHNFTGKDGAHPFAGLIFDAAGNLYGTTAGGGTSSRCGGNGCGTVFELTPGSDGKWTEKVLVSFGIDRNGSNPYAGVIFDAAGNLYGTTVGGGTPGSGCGGDGCGTVFELTPGSDGKWSETVLHYFVGSDGAHPWASLIFDPQGNLYGTTESGGGPLCRRHGCGTVFRLTPEAKGRWTEKVLHSFPENNNDGIGPYSSLILDNAGNLCGTTAIGGPNADGTIFELSPDTNDTWKEKLLHSFNQEDGQNPYSGLVFDGAGNLDGTTSYGGAYASGTVFQLSRDKKGEWTETVLHNFDPDGLDGVNPEANLVIDSGGHMYSTTWFGGKFGSACNDGSCGTVFEITP
jgi:uncharacterized repeat protein (TIGR03803 family)